MSRKTEEIKLRVTTLEKGWWQEAAVSEGTTVSELIRRVMNERVQAKRSYRAVTEQLEEVVDRRGLDAAPIKPTSDCHNHQCSRKGCASCDHRTVGYEERRSADCACGKPTYVFCRVCDV